MIDAAWYQERLDEENYWKSKQPEWKEEIAASAFIKNLCLTYRQRDVDILIESIVSKKLQLHTNRKFLASEWQKHNLQYVAYAHNLLDLILLKKLFNMECLWRAEEIRIEGVEICNDFLYWSHDLQNCPFLDPITQKEVDVLRMFMKTNGFEIKNWSWDLGMDYDFDGWMRKNEKGERDCLPEFFEYYDGLMGTFYLVNKPDLRSEKEEYYIMLYAKHRNRELKEKQAAAEGKPPVLAYFSPFSQESINLLKQTEPTDFWELHEAFETKTRKLDLSVRKMDLQEMAEYFSRCGEDVFLPAWMVWDDGMEYAYNRHRNEKAADVLELALEEYQLKAELRMFDTTEVEKKKAECIRRQYILEGRKLAGEREDFGF